MQKLSLFFLLGWMFAQAGQAQELKVAAYNIRNFNPDQSTKYEDVKTDLRELKKVLLNLDADLVSIEEIVEAEEFADFVKANLPGYGVALTKCGGRGNQKLGFLYKLSTVKLNDFRQDGTLALGTGNDCNSARVRPAALGDFTWKAKNISFTAISLHLKAGGGREENETRLKQFGLLTKIIKRYKEKGTDVMVMGDLNTTDYSEGVSDYHKKFVQFVESNDLQEGAAGVKCSSYWSPKRNPNHMVPSLLDHVLISKNLVKKFSGLSAEVQAHCAKRSCKVSTTAELGLSFEKVSDHCPLVVKLK